MTDHDPNRQTRRRGPELLAAIYAAVLEELAAVGYDRFSIVGVAQRARTGKASIYRRWDSKATLIVEAVHHALPSGVDLPDTGDVREDLLFLLRRMAKALAGPIGAAMRELLVAMHRAPGLGELLDAQVFAPRSQHLREVLARGVERGSVRPEALDGEIGDIGHELLVFRFLTDGPSVPDQVVVSIVDDVVLPVLRPGADEVRELRAAVADLKEALADAHLELHRLRSRA
ncbi:TetR/AcrR family transcriptional regulator [Saccharopolyspora indica]|uniref:TetR/AcrR family transcriptional regulator n=1 Tax=Saccharopolyspora indica TaxID=1229659 RepID=UPI0022EB3BBB|nr:TetR/AcrR family transcriptional regulator [Saccharopolyspora indica]MDA3647682.1 TetR/AcrR family transcriptional regulator [Saccharopolyspora indica]